jgi:hypothetical protein
MDCVLQSFSHASDVSIDSLVKAIGHNGLQIVDANLEPPFCYRGFSIFELSRVLLDFGWSTTMIPKYDTVYNVKMHAEVKISDVDRIAPLLTKYAHYCLSSDRHMIGYNYNHPNRIKDTMGLVTDISTFDYQMMYILS